MNYNKFFELAKKAGIEEAELYICNARDLSFSLFHGEVDKYSDNNGTSVRARGLVNGKFGAASCDVWDSKKMEFLVNEIAKNAKVNEDDDPHFIFDGSPKYKKVSTYNRELENISIDTKMEKLKELEKEIKNYDKRVIDVEVEYSESSETITLVNSKGLKLTAKSNYFVYVGSAVVKEGEQVKNGYELFLDNDFAKFDVKDLAKKAAESSLSQLGGEACASGGYKAVLAPEVVKSFLKFYIGFADAEDVQKKSSLFIGKLNQKIASSKLTIEDRPLEKNVFARWFDDEGVATYNKPIIKNGVLKTYLYNLTTAAKDGVESTGNGYRAGSSMGTASTFIKMKPGTKTQEELFKDVGNGVYITEVSGLHAGMNPQSGNFSLQSTGFLIKDGKKDHGLDIITVSGNLMDLFNSIVAVGSDSKIDPSGVSCPSITIKKLMVSGK